MSFIKTYGEHNCIKPVYVNADHIVSIDIVEYGTCYKIEAYCHGVDDYVSFTLFECKKDSIMAKPIMLEHICDDITIALSNGRFEDVDSVYKEVANRHLTDEEIGELFYPDF